MNPTSPAATSPAQNTLEGPLWRLDSFVNNQGQVTPTVNNSRTTAGFNAGRASGNAGCNQFGASYTLAGNKLTVSQAMSTAMACPDPAIMAQEAAFLDALSKAATYQVTANKLEIKDGAGKTILTFTALPPTALVGTTWLANGVNNGRQGVEGIVAGVEMSAVFGADGKVTGSAGCNTFNATYQVNGDKITIGPAATTRKACPQPIMDQEAQFLAALSKATVYSIRDQRLELRDDSGALQVSFSAKQ